MSNLNDHPSLGLTLILLPQFKASNGASQGYDVLLGTTFCALFQLNGLLHALTPNYSEKRVHTLWIPDPHQREDIVSSVSAIPLYHRSF